MTANEGQDLPNSKARGNYMTMSQAAAWFECSQTTVQDWYDAGKLDGWRTGDYGYERDEYGRWGTYGARRIYKDDTAEALREKHRQHRDAAAAKARENLERQRRSGA